MIKGNICLSNHIDSHTLITHQLIYQYINIPKSIQNVINSQSISLPRNVNLVLLPQNVVVTDVLAGIHLIPLSLIYEEAVLLGLNIFLFQFPSDTQIRPNITLTPSKSFFL